MNASPHISIVNDFSLAYFGAMWMTSPNAKRWGKWAGLVAFLFFLAKGLLWLSVIAGAWWAVDR